MFDHIKIGLALVLLALAFGIGMGISFGINEDGYKSSIAQQIKAHPDKHDEKSQTKIWRYAQRAHFHATGIAAFSLGLIILIHLSNMTATMKNTSSILIGMSGLYPMSWYAMFWLAPSIGRDAAHHHILTELPTYLGVGGLIFGIILLIANIYLAKFVQK